MEKIGDEVLGEQQEKEKDFRGEREEAEEEEVHEKIFAGERSLHIFSSQDTLLTDFCEAAEYGGEYGEQWVCEEYEPEGEYFSEEAITERKAEIEEEEEPTVIEKRSLDSEYLKSCLGTPLTFALLEIASKRPTDPIQYLAYFLLKWRWSNTKKDKYEEQIRELNRERAAHLEKLREQERQEMLEKEQREEELRRAERVESSLDDGEEGENAEMIEEDG